MTTDANDPRVDAVAKAIDIELGPAVIARPENMDAALIGRMRLCERLSRAALSAADAARPVVRDEEVVEAIDPATGAFRDKILDVLGFIHAAGFVVVRR